MKKFLCFGFFGLLIFLTVLETLNFCVIVNISASKREAASVYINFSAQLRSILEKQTVSPPWHRKTGCSIT